MSLCPQCGALVRDQAKYCSVCGTQIPETPLASLAPGNIDMSQATMLMPEMPESAAPVYLVIDNGQKIPAQGRMTIGREPQNNTVYVDDGRMSRSHAQLEAYNDQWILTDLQSANGTFVNGQRITLPTPVQIGDHMQMGETNFRLVFSGQHQSRSYPSVLPDNHGSISSVAAPAVITPHGGWRAWQKAPLIEGRVEYVDRLTKKRDDLAQRGCMAVLLGLIAAPLAFLPFMQGSDENVENIRVADRNSTGMVDVRVIGDALGVVSQGDIIAVWGRHKNGLVVMQRAYNYTTGHEIAVRK